MNSRARRISILLLASLGLTACPKDGMVWVEEGSTAERLVFGFGKRPNREPLETFGTFRVYQCAGPETGEGAVWVIGRQSGAPRVERLIYGQAPPPGTAVYEGPVPLTEGCYIARATTGGLVEFEVRPDGTIKILDAD